MSKPETGMITGLAMGLIAGIAVVWYFGVTARFSQFCLIVSIMMFAQLMGATIGATLGKPDGSPSTTANDTEQ